MKTLPALAALMLAGLSSISFAQGITIRVIDEKNKRPLSNRETSLHFIYDKGEPTPAKYSSTVLLNTDVNGEAHFNLPEPAPLPFSAFVTLSRDEHWVCWCCLTVTTT